MDRNDTTALREYKEGLSLCCGARVSEFGYCSDCGAGAEPVQSLLETCEVDQDGIIVDRDPVNSLLQAEERPSQRIFSDFQPTATGIVVFLILAFVALGLGIDTAMKGDLAAMRFEGNGASGR